MGNQPKDEGKPGTDEDQESLLDSLLNDSESDDDGNEQDEEQEQEQDQDDATSESAVDVDSIVDALEERLGARFDAVADRRVNAILKEVRKKQGEPKKEAPVSQTKTADVRAARLTFREYLTDEVQFIGSEERKFAMDLGAALIASRASTTDDEETLGREVADEVASKVKSLRSYYETRTLDALRRRGALKEKDGQPPKSPGSVGGSSDFAKGAALAEEMFKKTS